MNAGVVVVAGGEATRLPGKLTLDAGGVPLLVRTLRAVRDGRETFVSAKATFASGLDELVEAPLVIDRWPRRGPLGGLLSTFPCMRSNFVFAIAGDAPFVDAAFLASLEAAWHDGDEAVVPGHDPGNGVVLEPLAALYDRRAFLREGWSELRAAGSVAGVARRLRMRVVLCDAERLRSVNTPADYEAFGARADLGA